MEELTAHHGITIILDRQVVEMTSDGTNDAEQLKTELASQLAQREPEQHQGGLLDQYEFVAISDTMCVPPELIPKTSDELGKISYGPTPGALKSEDRGTADLFMQLLLEGQPRPTSSTALAFTLP